ncbi:MAG: hypothetical protein LUQ24_01310 [Methanobacterium sp.]|nr:hypothetical protein [Methanobacterium sp.]
MGLEKMIGTNSQEYRGPQYPFIAKLQSPAAYILAMDIILIKSLLIGSN